MNQDTNRPVQQEQDMMTQPIHMNESWNDMNLRQNGMGANRYERVSARTVQYKRAWYNQGWFWLIVAVLGIGAVLAGLLLVAGEVGGVSRAVREQTAVLREQNGLLASIGSELGRLTAAVDRIAETVRDAVNHLLASM